MEKCPPLPFWSMDKCLAGSVSFSLVCLNGGYTVSQGVLWRRIGGAGLRLRWIQLRVGMLSCHCGALAFGRLMMRGPGGVDRVMMRFRGFWFKIGWFCSSLFMLINRHPFIAVGVVLQVWPATAATPNLRTTETPPPWFDGLIIYCKEMTWKKVSTILSLIQTNLLPKLCHLGKVVLPPCW